MQLDSIVDQALELAHGHEAVARRLLNSIRSFRARGGWQCAHELVTLGLLAKTICTAQGILALIALELKGEAQILLRSLTECTVSLLYIANKPQQRAELYLDYQHIAKWRLIQRWQRNPRLYERLAGVFGGVEQEVERNYKRHKARYLTEGGKVRRTWRDKEVCDMAREVGFGDVWDAMYPIDCGPVHSGPDALGSYLEQAPDRGLRTMPSPSADELMRVLWDTMICLARVTQQAAHVFRSSEIATAVRLLQRKRAVLESSAMPGAADGDQA